MRHFSCSSEDGDVIKLFFRPQVRPLSSELITFRLIVICEAGGRWDIWRVALAGEGDPQAGGRMCHYQECQQSRWLIISNI